MENKLAKYGVTEPVQRPKIKPVKQLDLDTPEGRLIVLSEAKRIMQIHVTNERQAKFTPNMENYKVNFSYEGLSLKKSGEHKSIAELKRQYAR
ncbi:hypothetical protein [Alishewanella longhuensis]|nr:hypothetical protein [Alishewanella longhuensis]